MNNPFLSPGENRKREAKGRLCRAEVNTWILWLRWGVYEENYMSQLAALPFYLPLCYMWKRREEESISLSYDAKTFFCLRLCVRVCMCVHVCVCVCVCVKGHSPLAPIFPFVISVTSTQWLTPLSVRRVDEKEETFTLLPIAPNKEGRLCFEIAKYISRYLENKTEERHSSSFWYIDTEYKEIQSK